MKTPGTGRFVSRMMTLGQAAVSSAGIVQNGVSQLRRRIGDIISGTERPTVRLIELSVIFLQIAAFALAFGVVDAATTAVVTRTGPTVVARGGAGLCHHVEITGSVGRVLNATILSNAAAFTGFKEEIFVAHVEVTLARLSGRAIVLLGLFGG